MRMERKFADEYKNLGRNIALYRKKARLTQYGFALKANVSRGYLSQIEADNVDKAPSLDMVFTLAKTLNVPVYKLFMHSHDE